MKKTFCITARDEDLPGVVSRKEQDGFECYGAPVKILGGFSVQPMVEVYNDDSGKTVGIQLNEETAISKDDAGILLCRKCKAA